MAVLGFVTVYGGKGFTMFSFSCYSLKQMLLNVASSFHRGGQFTGDNGFNSVATLLYCTSITLELSFKRQGKSGVIFLVGVY